MAASEHAYPVGVPVAAVRESSATRTVNATMRQLSGSFAPSEAIPFFCECANPTCYSVVWMSPDVFDGTSAGHTGWMLVDGHEPSVLWHTREVAPLPGAGRALRAVAAGPEAPSQIMHHRRATLERRLARAS